MTDRERWKKTEKERLIDGMRDSSKEREAFPFPAITTATSNAFNIAISQKQTKNKSQKDFKTILQ